jgi:hypothetical protein
MWKRDGKDSSRLTEQNTTTEAYAIARLGALLLLLCLELFSKLFTPETRQQSATDQAKFRSQI